MSFLAFLLFLGSRVRSRPHICHFYPQMYFLGSIFLHMKARKLWQNLPKFPYISLHDNFFSTNIICDICDKYERYIGIYIFKQELKKFTCICVTKPGDLPLKVCVCRQQVVDTVAQNCCHCWEKKQINHHRFIRYFRNSLGVVSHAFGGHWQKSTDFTCNVNGPYICHHYRSKHQYDFILLKQQMTLEIGKTITRSTWLLLLYKTHAFVR